MRATENLAVSKSLLASESSELRPLDHPWLLLHCSHPNIHSDIKSCGISFHTTSHIYLLSTHKAMTLSRSLSPSFRITITTFKLMSLLSRFPLEPLPPKLKLFSTQLPKYSFKGKGLTDMSLLKNHQGFPLYKFI